jgi:hypothetical protein
MCVYIACTFAEQIMLYQEEAEKDEVGADERVNVES